MTDLVRAPGCPSAPPAPWEKCEALTQAGGRGGPALQTPAPRPQREAREGLGAPRAPQQARERQGRLTVNFAPKYGAHGLRALAAGTGWTERWVWREFGSLQGISGSRGGRSSAGAQEAGGGEAAPQCSS